MPTCSSCAGSVPDGARFCPHCGALADADETRAAGSRQMDASDVTTRPAAEAPGASRPRTPAPPTPAPRGEAYHAGTLLGGRYRIVGLLGRGGMGEVYRADDLKLGQPVALKFIPRELEHDAERLGHFLEEVRVARHVAHPNVCRVYDVGETESSGSGAGDARHFLTMEYIDGEDLATSLRRIGRFPVDKGLEIARQLCAGLAAVHDTGLLHRDLKPANVMLDGRGKVRLTDFGVAAELARGGDAKTAAGTPAYMAPELLSGKEASIRSDIYALGLVLYEVFTGKRPFEAETIADLRRQRLDLRPPSLTSIARDVDPAVEEVLMRCLDADPARRFPSALAVAAALPGGDPLAAALAAGETPSPAMVAAAGEHQGLSPGAALAWMAACVLGMAGVLALVGMVGFSRYVPFDQPPEVLAARAQELLEKFGYTDKPADTAYGLSWNTDYLQHVMQEVRQRLRFASMRTGRDPSIMFWYRASSRYLEARDFFGPSLSNGRVTISDPPPISGPQQRVWLDAQGRLLRLEVVHPAVDRHKAAGTPAEMNWTALFEAAGLDLQRFKSADPLWVPHTWGDQRAAWTGSRADQEESAIRVEAAAWKERPVYFRVLHTWTRAEGAPGAGPTIGATLRERVSLLLIGMVLLGGTVFAQRNLVLGRGDWKGATRLAVFVVGFMIAGWVIEAHHVPSTWEVYLFVMALAFALLAAAAVWVMYVALEPYVRRMWPHTAIAWSRLLAGQFWDARVGRDLLIGAVFGIGLALVVWVRIALLNRFGTMEPQPLLPLLDPLLGPRLALASLMGFLFSGVVNALGLFVVIFLLRTVLRKEWLTAVSFVVITTAVSVLGRDDPAITVPLATVSVTLAVVLLLRFGIVAYVVGNFVGAILTTGFPLTADWSRWWSGESYAVVALIIIMAIVGFRMSLGGRPLFNPGD